MSDLSARAQALVDSARVGQSPLDRDKSRIKRRVLARVAAATLASAVGTGASSSSASVGAAASIAPAAPAATAAASTVGAAAGTAGSLGAAGAATAGILGAKAALVGLAASVLVAGTVAAGWVATREPTVIPPAGVVAAATANVAQRSVVDMSQVRAVDHPEAAAAVHEISPTNSKARRRMSGSSLEQELPLLQGAQEALRQGDPARALALLDAHAKRFPDGMLAPERRAAHAIAACRSGNGAAGRSEAEAFVRGTPGSPLVERVRAICLAGPSESGRDLLDR